MSGRTQAALYAEIDHELSWSERDLPQHLRTKHVHRLHPYLGKFVPQLAETLLRRSLAAGALVYDPFAGSGTCLIAAEKTGRRCYTLELDPAWCDAIRDRFDAFVQGRGSGG